MTIYLCSKCNGTMSYDPYFKALICRQCGEVLRRSESDLAEQKVFKYVQPAGTRILNK